MADMALPFPKKRDAVLRGLRQVVLSRLTQAHRLSPRLLSDCATLELVPTCLGLIYRQLERRQALAFLASLGDLANANPSGFAWLTARMPLPASRGVTSWLALARSDWAADEPARPVAAADC
jgi:hypothetical protein